MSKKTLVLALIFAWGLAGAASGDLVGHWKFDEGSGSVAFDSSGNGNDGTLEGDPQWTGGQVGGALEFDGDDYVDCGDAPELALTEALTVMCWVNPAQLSGQRGMISRQAAYVLKASGDNLRFTTPGILDHDGSNTLLEIDTWQHVAATFVPGQAEGLIFYLNGQESERVTASGLNAGTGPVQIGTNQWSESFDGAIDDVRVYDHILTEEEIQAAMAGEAFPYAIATNPTNGSMIDATFAMLTWRPGDFAVSHNVYFGTDADAVADATPDDADVFLGSTTETSLMVGVAEPLVPGKTYYWRADAVNDDNPDSPWKSDVWSFWVQPEIAWDPSPEDGVPFVDPNGILTWEAGMGALFHTVYFGESFDEVNDAVAGGWMTANPTHDPGLLELNKTYYWRVDEFAPAGTIKGDVWSFTTRPEIAVSDPNLLAWWTLDEGVGTNAVDWSGHGHHGTLAGDTQWADGYDGGALRFDGQGDSADFGTPPDLYLPQVHSYTAWFKVGENINGDSGVQYILCIGSRSDLVFGVEDGVGVDGDLSLHYYDTVPGFHAIGVGKTNWRADEWHFVVGTKDAEGHKIYLDGELRNSDTNTNDDNFGGATTRIISIGARAWTGHQYYNGLIDDVRIYDKALTEAEVQDLMRGDPLLAWNPDPARDALVDIRDATMLRWSPGDTAASHDVYLGTDKDALELQANQAATSFSLAGLVEFGGGDYYWRIDEVEADGTTHTGRVWKFTVPPYLSVDDFESYTNDSPTRVFQSWVDGLGFSGDEFFPDGNPGNGTGALVGHDIWSPDSPHYQRSIVEVDNVHGGSQAMPLYYNNASSPFYSEAEHILAVAEDWTAEGVTTLVLYVRGDAANEAAPLYIAIEDSAGNVAVMTHPDPDVATTTDWVEWKIPLTDLTAAGVNTSAVKAVYIGLGNRNAPTAGGSGVVTIDDVRLIRE